MENLIRLLKSRELFSFSRSIMTTKASLEKALEKLQKNPYYEKYADRILELQKTSPEEFIQKVEQQQISKEDEKKKKFAPLHTRQYSSVLKPKVPLTSDAPGDEARLDDIFRTELVKDKDASEIKAIWEEYHSKKEVLSAVIPWQTYSVVSASMRAHPTFLFPLPRDHGYELVLSQCQGHAVHFTPLLAYQVHKENAPECLTVVHYTELRDKGVVLMRGEYDKDVVSGAEARCLVNQFQLYYGSGEGPRAELLRAFTAQPASFRHRDLIEQLENVALSPTVEQ